MHDTTTRGVLWELLAPIVRWPMYSPTRFALVVTGVLALVIGIGQVTGDEPGSPAATETTGTTITASPTATAEPSPSTSSSEEETSREAPSEATPRAAEKPPAPSTRQQVKVLARRFAEAYTATDQPRESWLQALRPLVTPELAEALRTVDPANIELGKVLRVQVAGVSEIAGAVEVRAARGRLDVELAYSGTRWQVTRVQPRTA